MGLFSWLLGRGTNRAEKRHRRRGCQYRCKPPKDTVRPYPPTALRWELYKV